jgi:hypothetical protein
MIPNGLVSSVITNRFTKLDFIFCNTSKIDEFELTEITGVEYSFSTSVLSFV